MCENRPSDGVVCGLLCDGRIRPRIGCRLDAVSRPGLRHLGGNRTAHDLDQRECHLEDTTGRAGLSSPVTFGDRIYLTAYTGYGLAADNPGNPSDLVRHVFCIRLKDGKVLWTKAIPAPDEKNDFNNWAVALHGFASSTPVVDKTGVYIFFGLAGVLAFGHDGDLLWQTSVGQGVHSFGTGNSPVLYHDLSSSMPVSSAAT